MSHRDLHKIRISASSFYFIMGLIFASWASRIPDMKFILHLNDGDLGKALFAIPMGQLMMMLISGYLVNKFGSRIILLISMVLYAIILTGIALSDSFGTLFLFLFLFGAAANMANIAVNTQACGLEAMYQRNIMDSFHGLWSLGGLSGGVLGAVFAKIGYAIFTHFACVAVISTIGIAIVGRNLLPRDTPSHGNG